MRSYPLALSRRRLFALTGAAALLSAFAQARLTLAATSPLPPDAVELTDGVFFPASPGGATGFYVSNVTGGPQFWTYYDTSGGHAVFGPPISSAWDDATTHFQLFAKALFQQPKSGGSPGLAPMIDLIISGPAYKPHGNATQLEFDGWPKYDVAGGTVHPAISAFLTANPGIDEGPSRSAMREVGTKRRNLFKNVGVDHDTANGQTQLGVLGQIYKKYFEGKAERLPSSALQPAELEIDMTVAAVADDLAGTTKGLDHGFGTTGVAGLGAVGGSQFMSDVGLWWDREQFIWSEMNGDTLDASQFPNISTDRNFLTPREIVGLLQFTPTYAGGGANEPAKFNVPKGLDKAWNHSENTWGGFVNAIVKSRSENVGSTLPTAEGASAGSAGLNSIYRWIPWNEPDICQPNMAGYAWNGTLAQFHRLVQVAYDAMHAANNKAELIFPTLGLVNEACNIDKSGVYFFNQWLEFLKKQNKEVLSPNNFFFHHISVALHDEPERVCEIVLKYRSLLSKLAEILGTPDPLAGLRKIILMESTVEDDFGVHYTGADRAHYIIQAFANALFAGANEVGMYKAPGWAEDADSKKGAETAVRYFSHVTRLHPNRKKTPNASGETVAYASQYRKMFRIDLPGPGFTTTLLYNRKLAPQSVKMAFVPVSAAAAAAVVQAEGVGVLKTGVRTSDHLGNEQALPGVGTYQFDFVAPAKTFQAFGKTYAWIGGGTRLFRYRDFLKMETPTVGIL